MSEYLLTVAFDTANDVAVVEKCDRLMDALVETLDEQLFDPAMWADLGNHEVKLTLNAIGVDAGVVEALAIDRVTSALGIAGISVEEIRSQTLELV